MVKFLVLGDHQTGKTSVIRRFVEDRYTTHYLPTVGCDFSRKTVNVSGVDYHIELWDLIGRDRIGGVAKVYYRKALGVILVCDADKPMFSNLMKWKEDIDEKVKLGNGNPVPVLLMMNKCDSVSKPIDKTKMDKFCEKFGMIGWFEASAKEGKGVLNCNLNYGSVVLP